MFKPTFATDDNIQAFKMLGLTNKSSDPAPAYEELEARSSNGYASVPRVDGEPLQHQHQHQYLNHNSSTLPTAATFEPHVHCEACDGFLQRQQKMRAERFCCGMVAATFMVAFVCILLLGVAIANSRKDKWHR
ncbi:hypothetical protein BJX63DRAFT_392921 [Aspergillus granulosus]|uniref:LITAF domain-containing protein n=1 Tax=Aspergillus granulosus TaxID=176169 RepID=A0ABR4HF58_9EURO